MPASEAWKRELHRKAFHQATLLYLAAYRLIGWPLILKVMAPWLLVVAVLDYARVRRWEAGLIHRWFGALIRPKESQRFTGAFYVTLGMLALFALHGDRPDVVTASVLVLSLGDAASPLVGMRFGWRPYEVLGTRRSLDGTLAGYAVAAVIGLACGFPWPAALLAAAAFSVVDTVPVPPDDNLWIPVVYGTALRLLEAGVQ